jgi:hypothetical protein
MSVSLLEVINDGGYDPLNNIEDSRWLLSKVAEFELLIEQVETYVEDYENNELDEHYLGEDRGGADFTED